MRLLLSLLLFALSLRAFAQQPTSNEIIQPRQANRPTASPPTTAKSANPGIKPGINSTTSLRKPIIIPAFPRDWQGKWKGTLGVFTMPNRIERVPMTLEIAR
ncbi:MAG: hypothetical protein H7Y12_02750, partial [Sphingobacteriaceae bacterium]|nr:hypothetical protein [Cytophagaceae bacterium]